VVAELLTTPNLRIERIVSTGQASPADQWYDQDWDEWVILLRDGAQLLFEDEAQARILDPGNYVYIPAHRRHRVFWTDPQQMTVWLAIHFWLMPRISTVGGGRNNHDHTGERATHPSNRRAADRHGGIAAPYQNCHRGFADALPGTFREQPP
jgi:cupin 2 domain-containing protein